MLYLFSLGTEVDHTQLHQLRATALLTSCMNVLFPFIVAIGIAPTLRHRLAPSGIGNLTFLLFLGISMSITALPVLARVVAE